MKRHELYAANLPHSGGPKAQLTKRSVVGQAGRVRDSRGSVWPIQYEVVPLSELQANYKANGEENPAFPRVLDPSEDDPARLERIVSKLAGQLDPGRLLLRTALLNAGAPIVGPDALVESGNKRVRMLGKAYQRQPKSAQGYRQALLERARSFGINPSDVENLPSPVLVRTRQWSLPNHGSRVRFMIDANTAPMSQEYDLATLGKLRQATRSVTQSWEGSVDRLSTGLSDPSRRKAFAEALATNPSIVPDGMFRLKEDGTSDLTDRGRRMVDLLPLLGNVPGPLLYRFLNEV